MIPAASEAIDQALAAGPGQPTGLGSAVAVGVASPRLRWLHATGATRRWRRDVDGQLQPLSGNPIDASTAFDLASLTKPLATLTLLVRALGQGRLALDDRLADHLPAARGSAMADATVGQLASHSSGAPAWHDFFAQTRGSPTQAADLQAAVLATPRGPAGQQAVYSDLGYLALGWLLEAIGGQPLDRQFADQVARPLGLSAGYRPRHIEAVVATEIWPPRCAEGLPLQGLVHDDNAAGLGGVAGHAGLFGSLTDVLTLGEAWLAALCGRETPLGLPPALVLDLLSRPGAPHTSWRHGWDTPTIPGSTAGDRVPADALGHLGFTGTSLWLSPSRQAVVVLLTNRVHPDRINSTDGIRALRRRVHDAIWAELG
jgi:CubicO group peptidase (beta-lactamase class C family)